MAVAHEDRNFINCAQMMLILHRRRNKGGRGGHGLPNIGNLARPLSLPHHFSIATTYLTHVLRSSYVEEHEEKVMDNNCCSSVSFPDKPHQPWHINNDSTLRCEFTKSFSLECILTMV